MLTSTAKEFRFLFAVDESKKLTVKSNFYLMGITFAIHSLPINK